MRALHGHGGARIPGKKIEAEFHRIRAGERGEFVDHRLHYECGMRIADRAPPLYWHRRRRIVLGDLEIVDRIKRTLDALDARGIETRITYKASKIRLMSGIEETSLKIDLLASW